MKRFLAALLLLALSSSLVVAQDSLHVTLEDEYWHTASNFDQSIRRGEFILVPVYGEYLRIFRIEEGQPPDYVRDWDPGRPILHFVADGDIGYAAQDTYPTYNIYKIDLSDPEHPQYLDELMTVPGYVRQMRIADSMLLVSVDGFENGEDGLMVFDISQESPSEYGYIMTEFPPKAFDYHTPWLALSYSITSQEAYLYDMSDLLHTELVQTLNAPPPAESGTLNGVGSLLFSGHYLYMGGGSALDGNAWLQAFDLQDIEHPVAGDWLSANGNYYSRIQGMMQFGDYLYVSQALEDLQALDGLGMSILDVTDPLQPDVVATIDTLNGLRMFQQWNDTTLCLSTGHYDAVEVDISDRTAPRIVRELPQQHRVSALLQSDGMVMAEANTQHLIVFDPDQLDSRIDLYSDINTQFPHPAAFRQQERILNLAGYTGFDYAALVAYDTHDSPPEPIDMTTMGNMGSMTIQDRYCYYKNGAAFRIYEMEDSGINNLAATYDSAPAGPMLISGDTLLITGNTSWQFLRFHDGQLSLESEWECELDFNSAFRVQNLALMLDYPYTTMVPFDISDPAHPVMLDPFELPLDGSESMQQVSITGNRVCVNVWNNEQTKFILFELNEAGEITAQSIITGDDFGTTVALLEDGSLLGTDGFCFKRSRIDLITSSLEEEGATPLTFTLGNAWPNPFNPSTMIPFELKHAGQVRISVYDVLGRHVATIVDRPFTAGTHEVSWNGCSDAGTHAASGNYIVTLEGEGQSRSQRITLIK